MAGRKVEVLEGELGQLKADFEEKIADFQNQIVSINEKIEGRFTVLEEMLKKLLEAKSNPATSEAKETIAGHRRGMAHKEYYATLGFSEIIYPASVSVSAADKRYDGSHTVNVALYKILQMSNTNSLTW
ncbi:hypothetical protein M5K25_006279 [Dendrobium thyrsiflorum]|uniref:Uncharacterized protein n=1 Tax=Dendrobium thyrsiflorum TaxID=117978 RepID=A0ABD0VB54_DENTH